MLIKEWSVRAKILIFFNCKVCEEKFDALVNLLAIITSTAFKHDQWEWKPHLWTSFSAGFVIKRFRERVNNLGIRYNIFPVLKSNENANSYCAQTRNQAIEIWSQRVIQETPRHHTHLCSSVSSRSPNHASVLDWTTPKRLHIKPKQ